MYPTREEAQRLLAQGEKLNPGEWVKHCVLVGQSAEKIANACGMNGEKAYALGLLHDIGRRFGRLHFGHIVYGYDYMQELGYDEVARACLTHSFPIQDISDYIGNMDAPPEKKDQAEAALMAITYDDYDRLIQLCDAFCMAEGITDLDTRMDDVARRYGSYPEAKRRRNHELRAYFEQKMAQDLYAVAGKD